MLCSSLLCPEGPSRSPSWGLECPRRALTFDLTAKVSEGYALRVGTRGRIRSSCCSKVSEQNSRLCPGTYTFVIYTYISIILLMLSKLQRQRRWEGENGSYNETSTVAFYTCSVTQSHPVPWRVHYSHPVGSQGHPERRVSDRAAG